MSVPGPAPLEPGDFAAGDPRRWARTKAILIELIEQPVPVRDRLLDDLARTDPMLHREVASLLAAHEDTGLTIGAVNDGVETTADPSWSHYAGRRYGAFRVVGLVGHGGMGTVFLAERADGQFQQRVALKIVRSALTGAAAAQRFRRERQILATLNHPNIAHLIDGGVGAEGEPYLVMEFVEGIRIDHYCAQQGLTVRQRLVLFLTVCRAVAYAHARQVIHRDLKPPNILVTEQGAPKLLDFGIAIVLDARTDAEETLSEHRAFTPDYASPEQLRDERDITPASDVYSLGVLLEALLAAAPAPAQRITGVDERRRPHHDLPPQLRAVIARARRVNPADRYPTAQALAEDVARLLDGQLVNPSAAASGVHPALQPVALVATAVVAGLTLAALGLMWPASTPTVRATAGVSREALAPLHGITSIAVLPPGPARDDVPASTDDQALRVGVAHAIALQLADAPGLTVRPIEATIGYLDGAVDPLTAGRELQVEAIVTGTLEARDEQVHTRLRMLHVGSGQVLWSDALSSDVSTALQGGVSIPVRIATRLFAGDGRAVMPPLRGSAPTSREAQAAYLRGTLALASAVREASSVFTARDAFERATRLDPDFALAQAGLATTYTTAGSLTILSPREAYPTAERAARHALALDPNLATAHVALADVEADYNWNWAAADTHYRRAVELSPNGAAVHQTYSEFLARMGRFSEAATHADMAQALDPTRTNYIAIRALQRYLEHRFDEAIAEANRAIARDPRTYLAYLYLAACHAARGDHAAGIAAAGKATALTGGAVPDVFVTALNHALTSDRSAARAALERLHMFSRTRYVDPFLFVAIHAYLGETEHAWEWMERSFEQRSYWMTTLKVHPVVDGLRGDPRFPRMLRRMGLD